MEKARAGLIGLGFGSEFIPIYQAHPKAEVAAICQRTKSRLDVVGDRFRNRHTLHRFPGGSDRSERGFRPHQQPDPRSCSPDDRGAEGRQARHVHRAYGDEAGRGQGDRRVGPGNRTEVHDGGNRRVQPGIPVHQGALRQGRTRQDSVPAGLSSAGHGRLARLLERHGPNALCDPRREPSHGHGQRHGGVCQLLRLWDDQRRVRTPIRFEVRRRVVSHQDQGLGCRGPRLAFPLGYRKTVSREHRRLRFEEIVRMAAHRRRRTPCSTPRRSPSRR